MGRPATVCLLIVLSLRGGASVLDAYERAIPSVMQRIEEVAKVLIPVPEDLRREMLFHVASYLVPLDAKSELCRNHSSQLFDGILNYDLWALRMLDASSKLPSGLIDGNIVDQGSPDQCVKVRSPRGEFQGKNCLVETKQLWGEFVENTNLAENLTFLMHLGPTFTVCVPSTCDYEDVRQHVDVSLNSVNASSIMTQYSCYTDQSDEPYTAGQRFMMFLIAVFIALIIASTIYGYLSKEKKPLLLAFSLPHNLRRLLSTHRTEVALGYIDGLRTIAMCWVVLGHRILHMIGLPQLRYKVIFERMGDIEAAPLENGHLAVEVFFLLTGLLVTYNYLRSLNKGLKFHLGYYYLFRYLRTMPALVAVILLYATLAIRFGDGPIWHRIFTWQYKECTTSWWTTVLHINNFVKPYDMCLGHTWFLATDFQLYMFSPVILVPLGKKPRLGIAMAVGFMVLTLSAGLWNAFTHELSAGGALVVDNKAHDNFFYDYTQTQYRAVSFLMGMVLGYFVYNIKQGQLTVKLSKATLWAGWLTSLFLLLFCILSITLFLSPDYTYNKWLEVPYLVFHRPIFSLSIVWVVFACSLGYGGYLNQILSWRRFMPISRLSYAIFLLHILVQEMQLMSIKSNISPTFYQMWHGLFGDLVMSIIFSTVLYLMVEAPFKLIIEILLKGKINRTEETKSDQTLEAGTQVPNIKTTSSF